MQLQAQITARFLYPPHCHPYLRFLRTPPLALMSTLPLQENRMTRGIVTKLHQVPYWAYSAIMGAGLSNDVAMLTDGRFSGGSHGFVIGHITPEAQVGGPIALVKNGDKITIDGKIKRVDLIDVSAEELAQRKKEWGVPPLKATRGTLYKFIKNVRYASEGCITDE
ncbi:hypothetical protein PsorP6_018200 [Peronosclerospora sorghi]|uniref:Uncharacterized protein n=1 Tax=Peronosclerospora sorghi TaxID=230839 RepID=A0ACC0WEP8_9STRA|nr:hypothetical protein PsorP6_018200 [Peronosclerospora sorghi]